MIGTNDNRAPAESGRAEPLQAFCQAFLALIETGATAGPGFSAIFVGLTQAIGRGCGETLAQLQGELQSIDLTADQLRTLIRSPLIRLGDEVDIVLERLENNRRQLVSVIDALSLLQSAPKRLAAASADDLPASFIRLAQTPTPVPMASNSGPNATNIGQETSSLSGLEVADVAPSPACARAESLCREAESSRQNGHLARADDLCSEAIRLDCIFAPAWLQRGRIRLLRGRLDFAIADFTEAIRLDERVPLALCWRADAHSISSRFDAAIVDYTQAMELQPDFLLAKYNRAVAYRQTGALRVALEEFDQILKLRPEHGSAYLNRGMIYELQGNPLKAAADFRKALRYQPGSREALQRLQAVRVLLDETPPDNAALVATTETRELQETPPREIPVVAARQDEAVSQDGIPVSAMRSRPDPAPREVHDNLSIRCPGCDHETALRWNTLQLGRVLACPHCRKNFTIRPSGELGEVVKDMTGHWTFRAAIDARRRTIQRRRLTFVAGVASAVIVLAMIFWTPRIGQSSSQMEANLPVELESRAELFAIAWLKGDSRLMRRLTDPVQDRQLFSWSRNNPPPQFRNDPKTVEKDVKVEVTRLPGRPPLTWVQVKFQGLEPLSTASQPEMKLVWEERAGMWHFHPIPQS